MSSIRIVGLFRKITIYFMSLLFIRIIIPDKLVLELHAHHHTTDQYASGDDAVKLEQKHTHCPTEYLFNSPFYFTQTILPVQLVSYQRSYQATFASVWKFTLPNKEQFRGPPVV